MRSLLLCILCFAPVVHAAGVAAAPMGRLRKLAVKEMVNAVPGNIYLSKCGDEIKRVAELLGSQKHVELCYHVHVATLLPNKTISICDNIRCVLPEHFYQEVSTLEYKHTKPAVPLSWEYYKELQTIQKDFNIKNSYSSIGLLYETMVTGRYTWSETLHNATLTPVCTTVAAAILQNMNLVHKTGQYWPWHCTPLDFTSSIDETFRCGRTPIEVQEERRRLSVTRGLYVYPLSDGKVIQSVTSEPSTDLVKALKTYFYHPVGAIDGKLYQVSSRCDVIVSGYYDPAVPGRCSKGNSLLFSGVQCSSDTEWAQTVIDCADPAKYGSSTLFCNYVGNNSCACPRTTPNTCIYKVNHVDPSGTFFNFYPLNDVDHTLRGFAVSNIVMNAVLLILAICMLSRCKCIIRCPDGKA